MATLMRESDDCLREPPSVGQERGLAYFRMPHRIKIKIDSPYRNASNLSDAEVEWFEHGQYRISYIEAVIGSRSTPSSPPALDGRDNEREIYKISGRGTSNDQICQLSEEGLAISCANFIVLIEGPNQDGKNHVYFRYGEGGNDSAFYIYLSISAHRMHWLWAQIGSRPSAEIEADVELKAFVREDQILPYSYEGRREIFLVGVTKIDGVSFHVVDAEKHP